jgi:protein TonB
MTEAGFYQQKRMSPGAMAVVVLLHGAAIGALMMVKDVIPTLPIQDPTLIQITEPKPPEPHPVPPPPQPHRTEWVDTSHQPFSEHEPWTPPPPPPSSGEYSDGGETGTLVTPPPPPPPPPPPQPKFEAAHARANLASYVSDADYPSSAIRAEEQGTTRFRLLVGPDGRVTDCAVTGSSGSSSLDSATCRIMRSRARFAPARDGSGNPTSDSVASSIHWVLPEG